MSRSRPGQGTGTVIQTIVGGQADFGPIDLTGGLLQLGNGQAKDFAAVAAIQQRTMAGISTVEDKGIARRRTWRARSSPTPPAPWSATSSRRTPGWPASTPARSLGSTARRSPDGHARRRPVDGIGQFVVGQPTIEAVTKKKAVMLPYSDVMQDLYGNVLITSTRIAKEDPDMVKRFSGALMKGLEYALTTRRRRATS